MSDYRRYFEVVDRAIDAESQQRAMRLHEDAYNLRTLECPPVLVMSGSELPEGWPMPVATDDRDPLPALVVGLGRLLTALPIGDDRVLMLEPPLPRCRHLATGIIPWVAGLEMKDRGFVGALHSEERVCEFIEAGITAETKARLAYVADTLRKGKEYLDEFENLGRYVHISSQVIHSPLDVGTMIWGSEMYTAMYEAPDLAHEFLGFVTDLVLEFAAAQKEALGEEHGLTFNAYLRNKGGIKLVEDTALNVSSDHYREFGLPYTRRLLERFGGAFVHYCGHSLHWVPSLLADPLIYGFQHGYDREGRGRALGYVHDMTSSNGVCLQWFLSGSALDRWEREWSRGTIVIDSASSVSDAQEKVVQLRRLVTTTSDDPASMRR